MLVSPTEPKVLRDIGTVSLVPESFGADFLYATKQGLVGVQRKEVGDLISSVQSGRLQGQLAKMKRLDRGVVLIEGEMQWTTDWELVGSQQWTISQHYGVCWSLQVENFWLSQTRSLSHTAKFLQLFGKWLSLNKDRGLSNTKKIKASWGTRDNKDWAVGVLSQIDGVGRVRAEAIYEMYGMPLKWTVGVDELQAVDGIGKKTAERIIKCLS